MAAVAAAVPAMCLFPARPIALVIGYNDLFAAVYHMVQQWLCVGLHAV